MMPSLQLLMLLTLASACPALALAQTSQGSPGGRVSSTEAALALAGVDPPELEPVPAVEPSPPALVPTRCDASGVCHVARPRLERLLLAATVELPGCQERLREDGERLVSLRRDLLVSAREAATAGQRMEADGPPPWGWVAVGGVTGALLGAAVAILAVKAAKP